MDEFIKNIIKFVLEEYDKLAPQEKPEILHELVDTFICFVGDPNGGKQDDKKNYWYSPELILDRFA